MATATATAMVTPITEVSFGSRSASFRIIRALYNDIGSMNQLWTVDKYLRFPIWKIERDGSLPMGPAVLEIIIIYHPSALAIG